MNSYTLSPEALVMISGSSKGTQNKYYDNGYWYKTNQNGYEGLSEYLVSKLLECTNQKNYVTYEQCQINGKSGCRSLNFLKKDESFISFHRLYDIYHGGNLSETVITMNSAGERIRFVKEFVESVTEFDISPYLSKVLTLDMITLNNDRHFNNLGLIINSQNNTCKEAPIFDNGASLCSNFNIFEPDCSMDEMLERAVALPFSSNFELQCKECGIGLAIDYDKLEKILVSEPDSRALSVLRYQVDRYRQIIPAINS